MKDVVEILKEVGYGVIEGKEVVLKKIEELVEKPKILPSNSLGALHARL